MEKEIKSIKKEGLSHGVSCLLVLLSGCCWGISALFFSHLSAGGLDSLEALCVRMPFAAVILFFILLVKDKSLFRIHLRDIPAFFGTSFVGMILYSFFYFTTMIRTSVAVAVVFLYTAPAFTVLLSALLFKEKITLRKLAALIIIFSGCVCVSGILSGAPILSIGGILFAVASGVCYAGYSVFCRILLNHGLRPFTVSFYTFLMAAVCTPFFVDFPALVAKLTPSLLGWGAGMGFFCASIPCLLYTSGMQNIETGEAGMLVTSEPVVAALTGALFLGEPLTVASACGVLLIICGISVMNLRLKKKKDKTTRTV